VTLFSVHFYYTRTQTIDHVALYVVLAWR